MGIDYELLGQRIREARIKACMTQATLSGIIGLSPSPTRLAYDIVFSLRHSFSIIHYYKFFC